MSFSYLWKNKSSDYCRKYHFFVTKNKLYCQNMIKYVKPLCGRGKRLSWLSSARFNSRHIRSTYYICSSLMISGKLWSLLVPIPHTLRSPRICTPTLAMEGAARKSMRACEGKTRFHLCHPHTSATYFCHSYQFCHRHTSATDTNSVMIIILPPVQL